MSLPDRMPKKHLVFVGGGHAHLTSLINIKDLIGRGHRVTVISSSAYQYYSGMGPGMLSGIYRPQDIRFNIRKMAEDRGGVFVEDRVVRVEPDRKTLLMASGTTVAYDIVSFNTGSEVPVEAVDGSADHIYPVKPIINLLKARSVIKDSIRHKPLRIVVTGGGPAGVEIAGNAWRLVRDNHGKAGITLIAGRRMLNTLPDRVRRLVMKSFLQRGITIVEGKHVSAIEKNGVVFDDGTSLNADIVFVAMGVRPSSLFRESGLPVGQDGGLLVNRHLQSVQYPEIFGGGDCISLENNPLAKVGVYAVRENLILYKNLTAWLEGGGLMTFTPQQHYMLIFNLGNGKGILWRKNIVLNGRLAFLLKDYIDKKFMRTFQVSGERSSNGT